MQHGTDRADTAAASSLAHRADGAAADLTRLPALLAELGIPRDFAVVLGVWPRETGGLEVHLSPATFWRTVKRVGPAVCSTARPDLLFPHRHAFAHGGVEFFTFTVEPVLPPGVRTPGFALRLT
jgi:hypothetical protein